MNRTVLCAGGNGLRRGIFRVSVTRMGGAISSAGWILVSTRQRPDRGSFSGSGTRDWVGLNTFSVARGL